MKLVMEVWKKFLKEQDAMADIDSMLDDADDELSGRVSPKIKQLQQRLAKLGMSKDDVSNFIQFQGMMGKRGENKEATLERKIAALEKFASTPLSKLPQRMKVTPGEQIELTLNQNSWSGKVGDPEAPKWVQTIIPGWQTKNPIYPASPNALGMAGREILFRKLRKFASQPKKAPIVQQKQAPAVQQKQAPPVQQKKAPIAQQKQAAPVQQKKAVVAQEPVQKAEPTVPNDVVKKVQSGKWTKGGKSFPKANPDVINLIYKLQGLIGAKQDGVFGKETARAIQRKYYGK